MTPIALTPAESASLEQFKHDLEGMSLTSLVREMNDVQSRIDEDVAWVEALAARIKELSI